MHCPVERSFAPGQCVLPENIETIRGDKMESLSLPETKVLNRQPERKANRFRQAAARRKLQELRDEEALRNWLTEVWDENPSLIDVNSGSDFH